MHTFRYPSIIMFTNIMVNLNNGKMGGWKDLHIGSKDSATSLESNVKTKDCARKRKIGNEFSSLAKFKIKMIQKYICI